MADGTPPSQDQVETWQNPQPQARRTLLSHNETPHVHGRRYPQLSHGGRKGAGPEAVPKFTSDLDHFPSDTLSEAETGRRHSRHENHDSDEFSSSDREAPVMVQSPTATLEEHSDHRNLTRSRPRGVTYGSSTSSPGSHQDPARQDSAYYSIRGPPGNGLSDADSDIQEEQLRARERVVILRRRVLRTRQIKRSKRDGLAKLRERTRTALDQLTRKYNALVTFGKIQEEIGGYYDEFRAAQDDLGPAEYEYERLEDRLEYEEQDLDEEEQHYYDLCRYENVTDVPSRDSKVEQRNSPFLEPSDPLDNATPSLDLNDGLLQKYLSTIEEALALRKELQNLENDYFVVSENANLRKRTLYPISTEMLTFISVYPTSHIEIRENLYRAEENISDLRERCVRQGVFNEDEYRYEPPDALRDELVDAVDEALERSPLRVAAQHFKHPKQLGGEFLESKRDYVNRWLLEWVQESTVDMMMLRTLIYIECPGISQTPQKTLVEIGDDRWTDCSLENWYTDSAGQLADQYYNASRFDAIAGDTNKLKLGSTIWSLDSTNTSRSSLDVAPDYGSSFDLDIMESEPASNATQTADLDTTPTKPKPGDGELTPTKLDISDTTLQTDETSDVPSTPAISPRMPTQIPIRNSGTEKLRPIILHGPNLPPPRIDEPEHITSPISSTQ